MGPNLRKPTRDELCDLAEVALIDMGRDALVALEERGFDSSDEQVFGLVERAVDARGLVALAVIHENRVLIIKYTPDDDRGVAVIPCADADQVARATLEYGDEMARDTIRFVSSH
jgi:hypothetical protein